MFLRHHTIVCITYLSQIGDSIYIEPITTSTVISTAGKLKPKLSSGHDGISSTLLKETICIISEPLTHTCIINVSLDTGIVHDRLKIAKVVPIYKAADNAILYKQLQTYEPALGFFESTGQNYVNNELHKFQQYLI